MLDAAASEIIISQNTNNFLIVPPALFNRKLSLNVGIWGSGNEQNAQTIIILVLVLTHSRTRNVGAT